MSKIVSAPAEQPSTSQANPNGSEEEPQLVQTDAEDHHSATLTSPGSTSVIHLQEQQTRAFIEDTSRSVQDLIEKINDRRSRDLKLIDNFQEMLVQKVTEICQQMKEHMYKLYEKNSSKMQVRLQELTVVLENCTKLSMELVEATQDLTGIREDLNISAASESQLSTSN